LILKNHNTQNELKSKKLLNLHATYTEDKMEEIYERILKNP